MGGRRIILSQHAMERLVKLDVDPSDLEKTVREGESVSEGRNKVRYRLRTKNGLIIAICREFPEQILVITIMRRR